MRAVCGCQVGARGCRSGSRSPRETIRGHRYGLPRPRGSFPQSRPMGDLAFHRVALYRTSRRRWPSRTACPRSSRRLHHVVARPESRRFTSRSTRRPRPERRPGAGSLPIARLGLYKVHTQLTLPLALWYRSILHTLTLLLLSVLVAVCLRAQSRNSPYVPPTAARPTAPFSVRACPRPHSSPSTLLSPLPLSPGINVADSGRRGHPDALPAHGQAAGVSQGRPHMHRLLPR